MARDTNRSAAAAQLEAVRRLGPEARLALAARMSEDARPISIEGERRRHPKLTEHEARQIVFRRMWGAELAGRVPQVPPLR